MATATPSTYRFHATGRGVRPCDGFTLVELVVTMVIMAIISSVALASYRSFTLESRRATATTALSDAASRQEQFYLNNKTYTTTLGAGGLNVDALVDGGYYQIEIVTATASTWVMRAVPQGTQGEDSCGTLTYTSEGDRTPAECW